MLMLPLQAWWWFAPCEHASGLASAKDGTGQAALLFAGDPASAMPAAIPPMGLLPPRPAQLFLAALLVLLVCAGLRPAKVAGWGFAGPGGVQGDEAMGGMD